MQYKSINRESLTSYLDDYSQRGEAIVFVHRRGLRTVRWSYEKLVNTAWQTAQELQQRGIGNNDRVLLCGENSPEWIAAFWACLLVGAVAVPLDSDCTAEFACSVREQTEAKLVFAGRNASGVSTLSIARLTLDSLTDTVGHFGVHRSGVAFSSSHPHQGALQNALAQIIFTSGTTSAPKGVMLTHENLLANLLPIEDEIKKYLKWEQFFHPVRFLNLVPLSHVFGQFMGIFVPQLLGGEVHFLDTLNPAELVEHTRKNRISVLVLVPRILGSLRNWLLRSRTNSHSSALDHLLSGQSERMGIFRRWWRFRSIHRFFGWKFWAFISGGAALDTPTEDFWRKLGFLVLQGYGMTETASLISVTHPFKGRHRSIGKVLPGYEMKLDETGEIIVRGPSVSPGYWTKDGGTVRTDEWLHTGDVGAIDKLGDLHFKGRKKEAIVTSSGLNVYPEDLEEALNMQPEIQTSCVITWSGSHGDEPMAVIILKHPGARVESIIERANERLAEYQRIRQWHIWNSPDFPRTATQKILKRKVAAKVKSLLQAGSTIDSPTFVLAEAARIGGEKRTLANDPSLKLTTDLKLDSLGRVELMSALEERFQIDIDEAAFTDATTVGDVERIVRGEVAEVSTPYPYPTWSYRFPITWMRLLLFYTIILPITLVMSRMSVKGLNKVANLHGPALFVSNHVTLGDHALILAALPIRLRHRVAIAMEGERLRDWLHPRANTSWLMRLTLRAQYVLVATFFHIFPLPRKSGFRRSFGYAAECVDRGLSVLVFPEGVRAPRGQMHMSSFKTGIGVLASELDIPVIPVGLEGLYELKRRRQYFASKGTVSVTFGAPVRFGHSTTPAEITEELHRQVEKLVAPMSHC